MKTTLPTLLFALCATLLSGCASHYQLGTTLPPELRDVYIPTILNEGDEPGVAQALDRALRKEIQREGTLRIVPEEEATTRLEVVVVSYAQRPVSYRTRDTQSPNAYRMTIVARVSFVKLARRESGTVVESTIWQNAALSGSENFAGGADSVSAKMSCLPQASKNLAVSIVDGCVGAW